METQETVRKGPYTKPNDLFVVEIIRFHFQTDFNLLSRTINVNDEWNKLKQIDQKVFFNFSLRLMAHRLAQIIPAALEVLGQYKHYLHCLL